ncbi:hypothetical protein WME73_10585 [Sorangium sp. So ce302]|uniref:hypothetical protein n=1 Tax=Sorangium sp. So ce302 TaxID=3133297 RepID=UPI003F64532B
MSAPLPARSRAGARLWSRCSRTGKRESKRFYRFLGVSYPNVDDLNRARAKGIEKPGGAIGIHGSDPRLAGLARAWIRLANAAGLQKLWGPPTAASA